MHIFTRDLTTAALHICKAFAFFLLFWFFISPKVSKGQSLSVTSINGAANGITPSDITYGQKDIVLFGFGLTVSSTVTLYQINIACSEKNIDNFFSNGRVFKSNDPIFSSDDIEINATVSLTGNNNVRISPAISAPQTITPSNPAYYFLVADYTNNRGTVGTDIQFAFENNQKSDAFISSTFRGFNTFNIPGQIFNTVPATITMTSANSIAENGITQGPLSYGDVNNVLFGFGLTVKGYVEISDFYINGNGSTYFGGGRLFRSDDEIFSEDDIQISSNVTFNASQVRVILSETLQGFDADGETKYYFLVADYTNENGNVNSTIQFSFTPNQANPAIRLSNPSSTKNGFSIVGQTFSFAKLIKWTGNTSTAWSVGSNWTGGVTPGINDVAYIGSQTIARQPVVTGSQSVGNIILTKSTSTDVILTVNGSLTVAGDITQRSIRGNIATQITGTGSLSVTNIRIAEDGINATFNSNYTTKVTSTIATLTTNKIIIRSEGSTFRRNDASFTHESGTVNVNESIETINIASGNTSSFTMNSGAKTGILNLRGRLILSSTGNNNIDFRGGPASYVNYNGTTAQAAIGGAATYNVLKINNPTGVSLAAAATIPSLIIGDETPNSVFDEKTFGSITSLSLKNNSKFISARPTFNFPATTVLDPNTTLEFNAGGNQTINIGTRSLENVILSGSGTKTISRSTNGPLNINSFTVNAGVGYMNVNGIVIKGDFSGNAPINSATLPITIAGSWTNTAPGLIFGTVTYDGTDAAKTQLVSADVSYTTLNLIDAAKKAPNSVSPNKTLSVSGNLNVSSPAVAGLNVTTIDINGNLTGNSLPTFGNADIHLAGSWTNTASGNLTGTVTYDGISQSVVTGPTYKNLTLKGNGTLAPAAKTIGSGTLKVAGNLTLTIPAEMRYSGTTLIDIEGNLEGDEFINSGTLPINIGGDWNNTAKGELGGLVTYDGQNNQKVAGLAYTDVLFTNGGTKTLVAAASVSGELEVKKGTGTNTILNANGNLTLLASANNNANIKKLETGTDITGLVTVQTYVSGGKRSYLTFSSPVYDNTNSKGNVFTYKQLQNYMIVTGARNGGFDPGSAGNPYGGTIRTYFEPASPTQTQYYSPTNINETIESGKAFYVFYRGNRSNPTSKLTSPYATPEANTIEFKGLINKGDITVPLSYTNTQNPLDDGFNHLGNPYPSTIDFHLITKSDPEITKIWILRKDGFYAVYDSNLPGAAVNGASRYIPPGQGFFVKATKAGSTVTFTENSKVTSKAQKPLERFMAVDRNFLSTLNERLNNETAIPYFRLAMKKGTEMTDETVIAFKENADSNMDEEDALYMGGAEINFSSLSADNKSLAINYVPEATDGSIIKLNVSATASGDYSIALADIVSLENLNIYLKDEFLNSTVDLKVNSTYTFRIDKTRAASFGSDRFKLVFEQIGALPTRLVNFTGKKSKVGTELKWVTAFEKNIERFEIERSPDGREFTTIGRVESTGNSKSKVDYQFEDRSPIAGTNYYRLKQVGINGTSSYMDPITVDFSVDKNNMDLKLYPNPTVDEIYVSLEGLSGKFAVRIFNTAGYEVKNSVVNYSGPVLQKVSDLQKGTYFIRVTDSNTNTLLAAGKFIKN